MEYLQDYSVAAPLGFPRERHTVQASANDQHLSFLHGPLDSIQPKLLPNPVLDWGIADRLDRGAVRIVAAKLHSVRQFFVDACFYPNLQ